MTREWAVTEAEQTVKSGAPIQQKKKFAHKYAWKYTIFYSYGSRQMKLSYLSITQEDFQAVYVLLNQY